jgi:molybdenum cofactor cytidylyltransferase
MRLSQALRVRQKDVIAFVGGGGKTTAMFRLADELAAQNKRVIATTTTRIFATQTQLAPQHLLYDFAPDFAAHVRDALGAHPHILIVGAVGEEGKAFGVPPALIDELIALDEVDAVINEADGSRKRPFKAPAAHEPVLSDSTTILVPVVGAAAIGAPLDDAYVHRAEIVARLAGARLGETITPTMVARVIAHAEGGLKNRPRGARAMALVNQVESAAQLDAARALARLLLGYAEIEAVALGAVLDAQNPVHETHRRVAAIVLAAGAGTRMGDRVKQLLPWRGKTLVENAIDIATQSSANETIVVLGAFAEEIRAAIHGTSARVVLNRDWAVGHSASIRAGLRALSAKIDAAIFINADQPLLTSSVIDAILQRYRETDARIVGPFYAGQRGSPVLFDRAHFDALMDLQGEQGGRELLVKYREQIERVELADVRAGMDIDTLEDYESSAP